MAACDVNDTSACGAEFAYGQCVDGICACSPYTSLMPDCSQHISEMNVSLWAIFETANVVLFGIAFVMIALNTIHLCTSRSKQSNQFIIIMPLLWAGLRVIWPLIPVRSFEGQLFYLWLDLMGADFGMAFASFSAVELAALARRHGGKRGGKRTTTKAGERSWKIVAAIIVAAIFGFEIIAVFVSIFLGIDVLTIYIIVDIVVITFFVVTIMVSASIIIKQLRIMEHVTKSSERRKRLAAFGLTLSIPAILYIVIGIADAITGFDMESPEKYVLYFSITRILELVAVCSILVKRSTFSLYPLMCFWTRSVISLHAPNDTTSTDNSQQIEVADFKKQPRSDVFNTMAKTEKLSADTVKIDLATVKESSDSTSTPIVENKENDVNEKSTNDDENPESSAKSVKDEELSPASSEDEDDKSHETEKKKKSNSSDESNPTKTTDD